MYHDIFFSYCYVSTLSIIIIEIEKQKVSPINIKMPWTSLEDAMATYIPCAWATLSLYIVVTRIND